MKRFLVIDAGRKAYSASDVGETMTVGDLIGILSGLDEDTPVVVGNDNDGRGYGWYTYGALHYGDLCDWEEAENDEEEEILDRSRGIDM